RQLDQPLELSVGPLDVEEILLLHLLLEPSLALDREQVARDRHGHVLLTHPGSSSVRTRSSFVAYMSTGGAHTRPFAVAGRATKLSKRRFTSVWMPETPNGSHRSAVESPNGRQRSVAIGWILPGFFADSFGRLLVLSTYSLYQ